MNVMTRYGLHLMAALTLTGCATGSRAADPFGGAEARPVRVEVVNRNFNDATIWAVYPSVERIRLGVVGGKSESVFSMRALMAQPVYMEIDLIGGERCVTDQLTVDEGDVLYLEIEPELSSMRECR